MPEVAPSITPLQQAELFCAGHQITLPPVPASLAVQLKAEGPFFHTLFRLPDLLTPSALLESSSQDLLAFGVTGRGIQSWFWSYTLRYGYGALTLATQLPFGGALDNPEERRDAVNGAVILLGRIITEYEAKREVWPAGAQLIVEDYPDGTVRWKYPDREEIIETELPLLAAYSAVKGIQ